MKNSTGRFVEWFFPAAFLLCAGWAVWHMPAYILDFFPHEKESTFLQVSDLLSRKDVTPNLPGIFGGFMDIIDLLALVMMPVFFYFGTQTLGIAAMEFQKWRRVDRFAMFVGRITMIMIITMTGVMLYEVFLRYAIEKPTLWANELTLWIAGFVFLSSGLYAMQQRSHIRIFILYDMMPRPMQRVCDAIWVFLLAVFACFLIFGSFKQVFVVKFYRWEMWGTAFDPPIPATIQPWILIIIALVAIQAILNLISDWNLEPEKHTAADDIDPDEIEAIKRSVGAE